MIRASAYFVKSTPFKSFQCIISVLCKYVTGVLQMCMKKFEAVVLQGFELSYEGYQIFLLHDYHLAKVVLL